MLRYVLLAVHFCVLSVAAKCSGGGACDETDSMRVSLLQKRQIIEHTQEKETAAALEARKAEILAEMESLQMQIDAAEHEEEIAYDSSSLATCDFQMITLSRLTTCSFAIGLPGVSAKCCADWKDYGAGLAAFQNMMKGHPNTTEIISISKNVQTSTKAVQDDCGDPATMFAYQEKHCTYSKSLLEVAPTPLAQMSSSQRSGDNECDFQMITQDKLTTCSFAIGSPGVSAKCCADWKDYGAGVAAFQNMMKGHHNTTEIISISKNVQTSAKAVQDDCGDRATMFEYQKKHCTN